jgi:hypothetical protein
MQQPNVEAQRARVAAKAGPALYLAKLFGSNDTEAVVRVGYTELSPTRFRDFWRD